MEGLAHAKLAVAILRMHHLSARHIPTRKLHEDKEATQVAETSRPLELGPRSLFLGGNFPHCSGNAQDCSKSRRFSRLSLQQVSELERNSSFHLPTY